MLKHIQMQTNQPIRTAIAFYSKNGSSHSSFFFSFSRCSIVSVVGGAYFCSSVMSVSLAESAICGYLSIM